MKLLLATYWYGPFGAVIRATGPMAKLNPFRFSTKYDDDECDFLYYGYRYYNPGTGRWLSRDPMEEGNGEPNLYAMVKNETVAQFDLFGLSDGGSGNGCCGVDVTAAIEDVLFEVQDTFLSAPNKTRCAACDALYNPSTATVKAWDIHYLANLGVYARKGTCGGTVTYKGNCVWASALNYILFGKANSLCRAAYRKGLVPAYPLNLTIGGIHFNQDITWTLADMDFATYYHKFFYAHGGLFGNDEALAAVDFATEGYTGRNPHSGPDGPGGCTINQTKMWELAWHWFPLH